MTQCHFLQPPHIPFNGALSMHDWRNVHLSHTVYFSRVIFLRIRGTLIYDSFTGLIDLPHRDHTYDTELQYAGRQRSSINRENCPFFQTDYSYFYTSL